MEPERYCRDVEAYLCRQNDGHLVRIVGPAFDLVRGWEASGVPLSVVFRGIDRTFARYYAKGPRRRPVRIEFCEADVFDVFDEWRRALGLPRPGARAPDSANRSAAGEDDEPTPARRASLSAHLDRAVARLAAARSGAGLSPDLRIFLDDLSSELEGLRARSKGLRGDARERVVSRLAELDGALADALAWSADASFLDTLRLEAEVELEPFRSRMPPEHFATTVRRAAERLLRDRLGLPDLRFDLR